MSIIDREQLRSKIDFENLYVDFALVRTSLSVGQILGDFNVSVSEPNEDGECRGKCPKCERAKSFALNINTSRFNCFAKGCVFKDGGSDRFYR